MALPILETATFELTLPSSDVQVKFRPFQVKEEKVLLQALESQKQKQIVQALKDIISVCTFGQLNVDELATFDLDLICKNTYSKSNVFLQIRSKLNVDELATFDLEYVFLQIRSKSVGEIANLKVLCPDDKSTYANVSIDISEVEVHVDDQHTNKIMVDEAKNISIIMKYPTIASIDPTKDYSKGADIKVLFEMIGKGIYQISEGEKVHMATDYTKEELDKFIESIPSGAFKQIQKFYETMPKLRHELEVENPKTKVKSKITLQGLTDFFG